MNQTEKNLLEALSNLGSLEESKIFYRLYYDEHGNPLFYSMEDLPGNYIEIDQETFCRSSSKVRVVNGKLVYPKSTVTRKLVPNEFNGTPCDPGDISVVVGDNQPHTKWKLQTYEQD